MLNQVNPKIIGAFVVGLALVAGSYTVANFGKQKSLPASAVSAGAPARIAITTTDKDNNGIEDWRDQFFTTNTVVIDESATSSYVLPTTLTGQLGIDLFQNLVRSRNAGPFGQTNEQLVDRTVTTMSQEATDKIYGVSDVSIIDEWDDQDIKNYANTMGGILLNSKSKNTQSELDILNDIVTRGKTDRIGELVRIRDDYQMFRDESLKVPVPRMFLKQHLDLINTYNALFHDLNSMTLSLQDPTITLIRLKRYNDDAVGLGLALQNMQASFQPYGNFFSPNDPVMVFNQFSNLNQP